jgi:hypothetical protein
MLAGRLQLPHPLHPSLRACVSVRVPLPDRGHLSLGILQLHNLLFDAVLTDESNDFDRLRLT